MLMTQPIDTAERCSRKPDRRRTSDEDRGTFHMAIVFLRFTLRVPAKQIPGILRHRYPGVSERTVYEVIGRNQ